MDIYLSDFRNQNFTFSPSFIGCGRPRILIIWSPIFGPKFFLLLYHFLIVADDAYFLSLDFQSKILTFFSDKDNFQSTVNCGRRCKLLSLIFRAIVIPISNHVKCPFCQRITLVGIRFWGQTIPPTFFVKFRIFKESSFRDYLVNCARAKSFRDSSLCN